MARNFSGAATDRVTTGLTAHSTQRTIALWTYRSGEGGGSLGRLFARTGSTTNAGAENLYNDGTANYHFARNWSVAAGRWDIARPSANAWHLVVVTYDGSSIANDPVVYFDGVSQTVTRTLAPDGVLTTSTDPLIVGNTPAANRNWDGNLAEFVVYDRILTAAEVVILMRAGPRALPYVPAGWWPIFGAQSPEPDWSGNNNHGTVTGTVRADHPPGIALWPQPRRVQVRHIIGTIAVILGNFVSAITGTTTIVGTMSPTLGAFTSSIAGTTTILGTMAVTLAAFTSAISGTTSIIGTIAVTLGAFVSAMTGTTTVSGTMAALLSPFVSAIQGTSTVLGSMAVTLGNFISNMSGTVGDVVASVERVARRLLMFITRR